MQINSLIKSSRPKTLLVGISPVILGSAYSYHKSSDTFSYLIFILTLICVTLLQTGTNVVNEYFDFVSGVDQKDRAGPKRTLLSGELQPQTLKAFYLACFITAFAFGIYLMKIGGIPIILIGVLSIIVAYCYTGGPYPLSHHCLGELTAFIFFGPVAVCGTAILQKVVVNNELILLSCIPGFISSALMSLNNLRDIRTDAKTNKKTIAIYLGQDKARFFTVTLGILPTVTSILVFGFTNKTTVIALLPPFLFLKLWLLILRTKNMIELNLGIASFGKYNVVYCLTCIIIMFLR